MDLKWNLLKWYWLLSSILSGGQKFSYIKKEINYLSVFSHDGRKPFSANETFNYLITFSFILESHCGNICCLVANFVRLASGFEEFFI